ncbi:MAG: hypothetical protein Q9170_004226 [Blastenia crenularia]
MATLCFPEFSRNTRLPSGKTYNYIFFQPQANKPYVLFLHGFPSSSYDWRKQVHFFADAGYGVIAPDLLGYGGTDKPSEPEAYRLKRMSDDIAGILDQHQIERVFAVGHDWGSFLLSRMANYHPERILAYAFLDVGYSPPNGKFNVDDINNATERKIGYPIFGYWYFFNAPDAADIMTTQRETSDAIIYPADPKMLLEILCPPGAIRRFYEKKGTGPLPAWLTENEMAIHRQIFSAAKGGYQGGLNWYKAQMSNLNAADEDALAPERSHIDKPTLLVVCTKDVIGVPALQEENMKPFAKDMVVERLDCGHWLQLEKPDEVNGILKTFFDQHL